MEIKKVKRAGVVGICSYVICEKNENYQQVLSLILQTIPYTGLGLGTRLGLENVKVLY